MLHVCPTPIGNLGDITLRVIETLKQVDLVAAEDPRRTRTLLSRFNISKPLVSFFEHNEERRIPGLVRRLQAGEEIALVSDAGMPGICDPGYRLVRAALAAGIGVEVLPGPSAIETALVASGCATYSFLFLGYLPRKHGERERALAEIASQERTCVAFESPRRLRETLETAVEVLGEREIVICRELTKRFEEISRGPAAELLASLPEHIRGEIVLVFAPAPAAGEPVPPSLEEAVGALLEEGLPARRIAAILSPLAGVSRNDIYALVLELQDSRAGN